MNPWRQLVTMARRSLLLLAASVLVALGLLFGSQYLRDQAALELVPIQSQLEAQRGVLAQLQTDVGNIQTHILEFKTLSEQGLVGAPAREAWVEALMASHRRLGLPDTLTYTLQPPKTVASLANLTGVAAAVDPDKTATPEPLYHDLTLDLKDIHEDELLALLADFRNHVKGRYRVQACALGEKSTSGLRAVCTLRFFTITPATGEPRA